MKGKWIILLLIILFPPLTPAQTYMVGHSQEIFYDSIRNRDIQTEIYYPANIQGDDVPVAAGSFPLIIFGHGFVMSWDSYQNFWDELTPEGYILCFPRTETGLLPNHLDLGLDLRFLADKMQTENTDSASLFYGSISPKTAIMGHSMGGGASFLAAENNSNITTLVNFAAAETNPSAIAAARNIYVPSLLFSGDDDCVTPPAGHQDIMYDSLATNCKTQISIINGGHCYFANYNFNCSLGEFSCNPNLNITRQEQQSVTFDFLKLWLDYILKDNSAAFTVFNDSLQNSPRINYRQSCITTGNKGSNHYYNNISVYPNPSEDIIYIEAPDDNFYVRVFNSLGEEVYKVKNKKYINISSLKKGIYLFRILINDIEVQRIIIKR